MYLNYLSYEWIHLWQTKRWTTGMQQCQHNKMEAGEIGGNEPIITASNTICSGGGRQLWPYMKYESAGTYGAANKKGVGISRAEQETNNFLWPAEACLLQNDWKLNGKFYVSFQIFQFRKYVSNIHVPFTSHSTDTYKIEILTPAKCSATPSLGPGKLISVCYRHLQCKGWEY